MGVISLVTNVAALKTNRYLSRNNDEANSSLERLSTGLRINRASDDAAGLAISSKLNADERVYGQGIRNVNDAISALRIAQGSVESLTSILTRLKELTEQAANGTFSLQQRKAINKEADQMVAEYNRIINSAEFNDRKLLDGKFDQLGVQAGYGSDGLLLFSLGEDLARESGSGIFSLSTTLAGGSTDRQAVTIDLNGDGNLDIVSTSSGDSSVNVQLGNGDGTFGGLTAYATGLSGAGALAIADMDGDGQLDVLVGKFQNNSVAHEMAIAYGTGNGAIGAFSTFDARAGTSGGFVDDVTLGDLDGDSDLDFVITGRVTTTSFNYAQVVLNNGNGTFSAGASLNFSGIPSFATIRLSLGDLNGDGNLDAAMAYGDNKDKVTVQLGNGNGGFGTATHLNAGTGISGDMELWDVNRDGNLDIIAQNGTGFGVRLGNGDGSFGAQVDYGSGVTEMTMADVNGDGLLDVIGTQSGGNISTFLGNIDGTFSSAVVNSLGGAASAGLTSGDFNNDGAVEALTIGANNIYIFDPTTEDTGNIAYLNLLSQDSALAEFANIDAAFERITEEISNIGANESRLLSVVNVLSQIRQESASAKSRIQDSDIAVEAARALRFRILQEAGTAVLSQANGVPELAVKLLNT